MHLVGKPSWEIRSGLNQDWAMVLYVRDAAGLGRYVLPEPDLPPLEPAVPAQPHSVDLGRAIREWQHWWTRTTQHSPDSAPRPRPPQWIGLEDLPAVRTLAEQHVDGFRAWIDPVQRTEMDKHRRNSRPERLNLTRFVNGYEQTLGRPVRPFVLQITVLPFEGSGGWVLNENHVVVSTHLNDDGDALMAFLQPVIGALT
jgi:hypothetical protein